MSSGRLRRWRRPLAVVPMVALLGGGFWLGARSKAPSAAASSTIERIVDVTSGSMRQTVSASGTLAAADTESLNFSVSGTVTAVNVKAGQAVTQGTVLAMIDSAALTNAVTQAQATLDSAEAKLSTDRANGASSAQIAADSANVSATAANLANAKSALAGASLVSPINGTVSVVNLVVGEQLGSSGTGGTALSGSATGSGRTGSAGTSSGTGSGTSSTSSSSSSPQVQVLSTGSYVVNLAVDDTQIGRLKTGQAATITRTSAAALGGGGRRAAPSTTTTTAVAGARQAAAPASTTSGTVTAVGAIATASSGVASFPVVVSVTGSPADYFAGATVQVSIVYNEIADALQVPSQAITVKGGEAFVTVVDGKNRVKTPVTTGLVAGGQTQINSGLTEGQQVLISITVPAAVVSTGGGRTSTNNPFGGTGTGTGGGFGGNGTGGARGVPGG